MIDFDEHDVEQLVTQKITWNSALKIGITFIIVIIGFILITFSRGAENAGGLLFFGITTICLVSSIMVSEGKKTKQIRQTLTIMKCEGCGLRRVKDFENGDYIFNDVGECSKCNGTIKIIEIYSIKIKERANVKENKKFFNNNDKNKNK